MLKRTVAAVLSLVLAISCLSVTAFAADGENAMVKRSEIEEKTEQVFAEFIGKPDAQVTVDNRLVNRIKSRSPFGTTAGKLADELSDYVLVEAKNVGEAIPNAYGTYRVVVLDNDVTTVYIAVDIAANTKLYRLDCFYKAVTELVAGQKELNLGDSVSLMDYNRVAGELALHMILYGVTAPIVKWQGDKTPSVIMTLYKQAMVADLNIDEDRVPEVLMRMVGGITKILYRFSYGLFKLA